MMIVSILYSRPLRRFPLSADYFIPRRTYICPMPVLSWLSSEERKVAMASLWEWGWTLFLEDVLLCLHIPTLIIIILITKSITIARFHPNIAILLLMFISVCRKITTNHETLIKGEGGSTHTISLTVNIPVFFAFPSGRWKIWATRDMTRRLPRGLRRTLMYH